MAVGGDEALRGEVAPRSVFQERHADDGVYGFAAGFHQHGTATCKGLLSRIFGVLSVNERVFEGGGGVGKVGAEVGAAGFFAGQRGGHEHAGQSQKVGGFEVVDRGAVDVGVVERVEGGAEIGGVALDAGVGPEEGLELESGDSGGAFRAWSL